MFDGIDRAGTRSRFDDASFVCRSISVSKKERSMNHSIGFVGAGQMARALATGFVEAGKTSARQISACDPVQSAREGMGAAVPGSALHIDAAQVIGDSDIVFLAVKPQHVSSVFQQLERIDTSSCLFVSILAGITLPRLTAGLHTERVVRVMPNTPCLVGAGAAGYCLGPAASPEDDDLVRELLEAVGVACLVPESLMDAVTGLSGSGPAFVYQVIEALSDGGVRVGLPRDVATRLAAQTVLGAAKMVLETGEHPGKLKDRVASPGGTTIAGLHALETGALRATLINAVQQSTARSAELGQET